MLNSFLFYGANRILGRSRGLFLEPVSWTHGTGWGNFSLGVTFSGYDRFAILHLVSNDDRYDLLTNAGITNVHKVGLPICYIMSNYSDMTAIRDKRLYVPSHSIKGQVETKRIETYISIAERAKCNAVLLPADRYNNIISNKTVSKVINGISFYKGAHATDPISLERVCEVFSKCHVVYTDVLGSHIHYATSLGCEVEIDIDQIKFLAKGEIENRLSHYTGARKTEMLKYWNDNATKVDEINKFVRLNKYDKEQYSKNKIGLQHKRTLDELNSLFTYTVRDTAAYNMKVLNEKMRKVVNISKS